jgi:hypothetical protein
MSPPGGRHLRCSATQTLRHTRGQGRDQIGSGDDEGQRHRME